MAVRQAPSTAILADLDDLRADLVEARLTSNQWTALARWIEAMRELMVVEKGE